MKKKVLSALLCASMVATMVAGCGDNGSADADNTNAADNGAAATTEAGDAGDAGDAGAAEVVDYGSGTITIWVAENIVDLTKTQAEAFLASNEAFSGYTVTVEPVGEGDAASNMITDLESGADIFGFAQDQVARLVSAGALNPVTGDYLTWVESENDAGAASAAKVGELTYAFPITSDNGYFLYYDKSVVTDPSSLEQIVADCEAAGKNFYMEINSGWYAPAFFFATGCEAAYETNDEGNFTTCNISYASDAGVVALREMIELSESSSFQNGSSLSSATNVGAIIDGTWDAQAAKDALGDNYACAKLPVFTGSDGSTYQMSGFGGFKLLGIKPQEDAGKLQVCLQLAQYLSSADAQLERYNAVGWRPSNLTAQADEAVKADEALSALAEQLAFTIPQGQYPDDFWSLATSLGDDVIAGTINSSASDEDLLAVLQSFQDTCISYAQ